MKPHFVQGSVDLRHEATRAGDEALVLSTLTFVGSHGETVRVPKAGAFAFITDGGTIPALAQPAVGNKWGPNLRAFVIHDWITQMQEVEVDGRMVAITFPDACRLLDEALVCCECNAARKWLIVRFVNTPMGLAIWSHASWRTDAQRRDWNFKVMDGFEFPAPISNATTKAAMEGRAQTHRPGLYAGTADEMDDFLKSRLARFSPTAAKARTEMAGVAPNLAPDAGELSKAETVVNLRKADE